MLRVFRTVLLIFIFSDTYGQSNPQDSLVDRISGYHVKNLQEKVHLTTDDSFYSSGDTVWFAGYVVDAKQNMPTDNSHLLHVEVINKRNEIISSQHLPLDFGYTSGNIPLPSTLSEGIYLIRAYTNWMRNYDASFFFYTKIFISSPDKRRGNDALTSNLTIDTNFSYAPAGHQKYDIQLFPEGGRLVSGLKTKIAVKVTDNQRLGINSTVKLLDENKNLIINYRTPYSGMGSFEFRPDVNKTYVAVVELPDKSEKEIPIPEIQRSGYVLEVNNSDRDSLKVVLKSTADLVNGQKMLFIPVSNGFPLFYLETQFPDSTINVTIPKSKAPGGIIQLYLLNEKLEPVAQRLVFNNYYKTINLSVDNLKKKYAPEEDMELELNAVDIWGKPVMGSFSASVINLEKVPEGGGFQNTILSELLLCSDIKGFVETPNYYFEDSSNEKRNRLDNLMLTQRWSRFAWSELSENNPNTKKFPAENQVSISGKILGTAKAPISNISVSLLAGEIISRHIFNEKTDSLGRFRFTIADSLKYLSMRLEVKDKRHYKILLDSYQSPVATADNWLDSPKGNIFPSDKQSLAVYGATTKSNNELGAKSTAINLQDVEIKGSGKTEKLRNFTSTNLNGTGQADQVFTSDFIEKLPNLEIIFTQLKGVDKNGYIFSNAGTNNPKILVLTDGVEGNALADISPGDVERIEFLKSPAYSGIYGMRGAGGVLLVTTKKGKLSDPAAQTLSRNTLIFNLPIEYKKEFYTPKFVHSKEKNGEADGRKTVYWKPDIVTDKNGRMKVSVHGPGLAGKYRLIIEGLGSKGEMCHAIFDYEVTDSN